nr:hypothetical protein [uncultured Cohaesibacter sp.]
MVEEISQFDVNTIGYRNKNKRLHACKLYFFSTLALAGFCRDSVKFATNMNKRTNPFVTMELFFNMPILRILPFSTFVCPGLELHRHNKKGTPKGAFFVVAAGPFSAG